MPSSMDMSRIPIEWKSFIASEKNSSMNRNGYEMTATKFTARYRCRFITKFNLLEVIYKNEINYNWAIGFFPLNFPRLCFPLLCLLIEWRDLIYLNQ